MNCIFMRRGYPEGAAGGIAVTISGTGDATNCCVQHNNTTYYTSGDTFAVQPGDTIILTVSGRTSIESWGYIYINNTTVASTNGTQGTLSYTWTVPSGITGISISINYHSGKAYYGSITVTTS